MSTPAMKPARDVRLVALQRFAIAITVLNLLGHSFLGFEQSWAQPLAALATAYATELLIEFIDARAQGRAPKFLGGAKVLMNFLLPAHITALAVSMLLYSNAQIMPMVFATVVAIASKALFRVRVGQGRRHFLNPSNFGITVTLLLFPFVGISPPYQFTENLHGWADWLLPLIIIGSGSFLNAKLTLRIPLILSWLATFALQAVLRSVFFEAELAAALNPMTGVAFLLFTFYMLTDPATTPVTARRQIVFGAAVAALYGLLMLLHVVFGLFFALTIVCCARGAALAVMAARDRAAATRDAPSGGAMARATP
jgi:enediyne biosynthesis protein E5